MRRLADAFRAIEGLGRCCDLLRGGAAPIRVRQDARQKINQVITGVVDDQARQLETTATGPSFDAFVAGERSQSASLGGRSVFGWEMDAPAGKAGSADQ